MVSRLQSSHNALLDMASMAISLLCLAHCALLPLVIVLVPFTGLAAGMESHFHQWMLILIIPISVVAIGQGLWQHRSTRVAWLAIVGITLLSVAATALHALSVLWPEIVATMLGSLVLLRAHWLNLRLTRELKSAQSQTA